LDLLRYCYGRAFRFNKEAQFLVTIFPILGLTCLTAVVNLFAVGACEKGNISDVAVGTLVIIHGPPSENILDFLFEKFPRGISIIIFFDTTTYDCIRSSSCSCS
jgi:hypothetical protein